MNERPLLACLLVLAGPAFAEAPLTLKRAVERAMERAPELAVARSAADEGAASSRLAHDAFQPEAFVSTTPGYSTGIPVAVAGRVPAIVNATVRETLYDTGRRAEALQASARSAEATGAMEEARSEAARSALALYAKVWLDQAQAEAARRGAAVEEKTLAMSRGLLREGRLTQLDVDRAALEAAKARQRQLAALSDLDLDQWRLRRLVDWPSSEPLLLAEDPLAGLPEPMPGDSVAVALAGYPVLRSMTEETASLRRAASIQARLLQPVVQAEGQYNRLSETYDKYYPAFQANSFSIGVTLALPIFSGGRQADSLARTRARLERLEAERRQRKASVELGAREAEAALAGAMAQRSLSRQAQGVAQEALRLSRLLATEGRVDTAEEARVEKALSEADEEAAKADFALFVARGRLLALRGELLASVAPDGVK